MVKYINNGSSGFQHFMTQKEGAKKKGPGSIVLWLLIAVAAWWLASSWLMPKPVQPEPAGIVITEDLSRVPVDEMKTDKLAFSVQGLRLSNVSLMSYGDAPGGAGNVRLLAGDKEFVEIGLLASGTTAPSADTVWRAEYPEGGGSKKFWKNADGIEFTRVIAIDDYVVTVRDTVVNKGARDISLAPYARVVSSPAARSQAGVASGAVAYVDGDIERESWGRMEKKSFAYDTDGGFVGFESQYWNTVVSVGAPDQTLRMKHRDDGMFQVDAAASAIQIGAGKTVDITTRLYTGPKTQSDLSGAAAVIPGLDQTIDYGWFWFLARPFLWVMNWLFAFVGNYGIAIILLTIALRFLMWPLTKKSYTSMAAMQRMQPEMQRIQKQYAHDKPRMQAEMMRLYQTHKTSPMSGCLPMLIQIPIFFALYKALLISVPMRHSSFLWIHDLSAADPTSLFNLFGLLPYGVPGWLMIGALPIIMGLTMWAQQRLQTVAKTSGTNDAANPMAQSMKFMKWMPLVFVVMFAWMPAGLVLYWTVSNLFGIGQMWLIKRKDGK